MRERSKTVFLKILTPEMRHIALVRNRADRMPTGDIQPEGWGLVGGGQVPEDINPVMFDLIRKHTRTPDLPEWLLHELSTAFREMWEEADIRPEEIVVNHKKSLEIDKKKNHSVIVFDAVFLNEDISRGLHSNDPKGQVAEARWIPVEDLQDGKINGVKIYRAHLDILNNIKNERFDYNYRIL